MRRSYRFIAFLAVSALIVVAGCRSNAKQDATTTVVDAAHRVSIASLPALIVGGYGEGDGQVLSLGPVAVDHEGRIWIADNRLKRLVVICQTRGPQGIRSYSPADANPIVPGDTLRAVQAMTWHDTTLYLGAGDVVWAVSGDQARRVELANLGGSMRDLAVGPNGRIHVLTEDYVKVYDRTGGAFVDSIGFDDGSGSPRARAFAVGTDGSIYVSARTQSQVLVYGPDRKLLRRVGSRGAGPGQFKGQVKGIAVDAYGNLYVRDDGENAVKVFAADGRYVTTVGSRGSRPGQSLSGEQLLVDDGRHRLLLPDATNYRIQIYDLTGKDAQAEDRTVYSPEHKRTYRPDQIVLTLGDNPETERRIAWKTDHHTTGTQVVFVRVDGANPASVDWNSPSVRSAEGSSVEFHSNLGPYRAHEVALTDLLPGARYAYRVGDGSAEGWSATAVFTVVATSNESIIAVVLGDSRNRMDVWRNVVSAAGGRAPAFLISTGDLVRDGEDMNDWNAWFHEAQSVFSTVPFMPCLGNHERHSPNYFLSFGLPKNAPPQLEEECYSFDCGPAHWVVLNSEIDLEGQARWLADDLRSTLKPWTFVFFHRPAYAGHPSRGDGNKDVRETWCDLFEQYGVDIAWQGHDHYYFRTKPIRAEEVVASGQGPIYVTTGGAGAPLYPIQKNKYAEVAESVDHYCVMTVRPNQCYVAVYRADGSILDRFALAPRLPGAQPESEPPDEESRELDKLETGE